LTKPIFILVGGGLASRDGKPLDWFEIIDADEGGFVKANARIDGDNVILSAPGVKHPVAMRFAWSGLAEPNLMNAEGLPASAFRAGDQPKRDWLGMNVPEAKDYQVVYDLDLTKLGPAIQYDVDNHGNIHKPFDRIAYFVELQDANLNTQDVFVSMDAFTDNLGKIGVPVFGSGADFQQNVANLDVFSNIKGIATGTGLNGGNIELTAGRRIYLFHSPLSANAHQGNGGNITFDPTFVILNKSPITAKVDVQGNGGVVTVNSDFFFAYSGKRWPGCFAAQLRTPRGPALIPRETVGGTSEGGRFIRLPWIAQGWRPL